MSLTLPSAAKAPALWPGLVALALSGATVLLSLGIQIGEQTLLALVEKALVEKALVEKALVEKTLS